MSINWIHVGNYLVGIVVGTSTVYVYNKITKKWEVCSCIETQGSAHWSANCPPEVKNKFGGRCP